MNARARGFTLIEVLVSVFLLSILSAFCYETLSYVQRARRGSSAAFERVRGLELAMHTFAADFSQLAPRPVRDVLGTSLVPALLADARSSDLVSLTRTGWPNPAGLQRPTLVRVTYTLDTSTGTLTRSYRTALDATVATPVVKRELLSEVSSVSLRFLDAGRTWQTQWPPLNGAPAPLAGRPLAVEVTIVLKDAGKVTRLIEVPG